MGEFEGVKPSLQIGLTLSLTVRGLGIANYDTMRAVARRAEQIGFDSLWLCDHFLTITADSYLQDARVGPQSAGGDRDGNALPPADDQVVPLLECWTALTALARDTERVRLGTGVLCNSFRHPAVLAKMASTLDCISSGRLELGIGAGWFKRECQAYGVPFPKKSVRIAELDEAVEIVRRMWTERTPTFRGTHYSIDGAICSPSPVQKPHPPIWIGGESERVHRIAARAADGVNIRWWTPEQFTKRGPYLDSLCREYGRDPATLKRSLLALLVVDHDQARVDSIKRQFAAIPSTGIIAGSPAQCASAILKYVAAGVCHFVFAIPYVERFHMLELVGKEVLPVLRSEAGGA